MSEIRSGCESERKSENETERESLRMKTETSAGSPAKRKAEEEEAERLAEEEAKKKAEVVSNIDPLTTTTSADRAFVVGSADKNNFNQEFSDRNNFLMKTF